MSEAEYMDDIGGYLADQDYIAWVCEEQHGDCSDCPEKDSCDYCEVRKNTKRSSKRNYKNSRK